MESAVEKKMAAVHFTAIPCEPYTAHKKKKKQENHIFAIFVSVLTTMCMPGLKILELFCKFL